MCSTFYSKFKYYCKFEWCGHTMVQVQVDWMNGTCIKLHTWFNFPYKKRENNKYLSNCRKSDTVIMRWIWISWHENGIHRIGNWFWYMHIFLLHEVENVFMFVFSDPSWFLLQFYHHLSADTICGYVEVRPSSWTRRNGSNRERSEKLKSWKVDMNKQKQQIKSSYSSKMQV